MDLVGKVVRKEFRGFGVSGVIESYSQSTTFFKITYQDGGSEEVGLSEASFLAHSAPPSVKEKKNDDEMGMRMKPKKRRRVSVDPANIPDNLVRNGHNSGEGLTSSGDTSIDSNLDGSMKWQGVLELDLNDGLKLDVTSQACMRPLQIGSVRHGIDLNLSVDAEIDDKVEAGSGSCPSGELKRNERGFDLNLGFDVESLATEAAHEEPLMQTPVREGKLKQLTSVDAVGGIFRERTCLFADPDYDGSNQLSCIDVGIEEKCVDFISESLTLTPSDVAVEANLNFRASKSELKVGSLDASTPLSCDVSKSGRRLKRKVLNDLHCPPPTSLRRSARQAKASTSVQNDESRGRTTHGANNISSSGMSVISKEKPPMSVFAEEKRAPPENEGIKELNIVPLKVELPPASINLNLERIPVLDLFSIYSCLRSFSSFLYLSPFGLEDFVTALKSNVANSLLDFVHVAILHTLRKHLELLSVEGSEFASSCLRSLNWDLLDIVTWPIFLAGYMLFRGCRLKRDVCIDRIRLFDGQYYQQPAENKIGILQCLCDDLIEVEAVRTELSRRTTASDFGKDINKNMNLHSLRKTRSLVDAIGSVSLNEDVAGDMNDWNNDECCLCRMEGNLICCDGCPAAYHSRCVGVASSFLPEGEWFCPECLIRFDSSEVWSKKLIRGAELLGVDPHGRTFMSCCGYLLVSQFGEEESLFDYYYKDDLKAVIDVLQSSKYTYSSIAKAIVKQLTSHGKHGQSRSFPVPVHSSPLTVEAVYQPLQPTENDVTINGLVTKNKTMEMVNPVASSKGSAKGLQAGDPTQTSGIGMDQSSSGSKHVDSCGGLGPSNRKGLSSVGRKRGHPRKYTKEKSMVMELSLVQPDPPYVNRYVFARNASSIAEELSLRSSDKKSQEIVVVPEESIISSQVKAISRNSTKFCWSTFQSLCGKVQREKCGWCYHCKYPEKGDCLFNLIIACAIPKSLMTIPTGFQYNQNTNGHLVDVICQILSMECRLQGLLLGPYLGPYDNKMFHKSALKPSGCSLVIHRLLLLESNLHPLALSSDWGRHIDSAMTIGSASHIVVNSHMSSKYGVVRKSKFCDLDPRTTTRSGLVMLWWRGGKLSRKLFNWKVLPRSLALRAARKGGCAKIPGLMYPDGSEYVKRSQQIAWRAAVETSTSVEKLALLVRELDSNIRWDEIENTFPHATLDKDSLKSIKLFKKAIVRRRYKEETGVKYLIDFGKRSLIPDVVVRHGSLLNDPTSERKKYWLQESYVPLHLIKNFEEKRIACIVGKVTQGRNLCGLGVKKPSKRNCFEYLSTRAEKADTYQCGHCRKLVPIREAVSCQYCHGFFHKRHARASPTAVASKCTYTCQKCRSGKHPNAVIKKEKVRLRSKHYKCGMKSDTGAGKVKLKRGRPKTVSIQLLVEMKKKGRGWPRKNAATLSQSKKSMIVSSPLLIKESTVHPGTRLRRSERRAKNGRRNGKIDISGGMEGSHRTKLSFVEHSEPTKVSLSWKRKRTLSQSSLWKNGLRLSRKPDDERTKQFMRKHFIPSNFTGRIDEHLKCSFCGEKGYRYGLKYVSCEICGDWFHWDVFRLDPETVQRLIGFRCHACLKREPPLCPHANLVRGEDVVEKVAKHICEGANSLQDQAIETRDNYSTEKGSREARAPDFSNVPFTKLGNEGSLQVSDMKTPSEVTDLEDLTTMEIDVRIENGHTSTIGLYLLCASQTQEQLSTQVTEEMPTSDGACDKK